MENVLVDSIGTDATSILKGLASALVVAAVAWTAIRLVLQPVKSAAWKWFASIAFCVAMIAVAHGSDVITYGDGPQGWAKALFFGVLGGFLAPALHQKIIKRFLPFLAGAGDGPKAIKPAGKR